MNIVNLFGRGPSLKHFKILGDCQTVVLSNNLDKEISQVEKFSEYLQDKKIHLCLNMVVGGARGYHSIDFFNRFNVTKLIRPYLEGVRVPGSSGQNIPLEETFLGKNHMEFMYTDLKYPYDYTGTGIAAFAHSLLDCSADVVNVIGIDFYNNLNYGVANYLVSDAAEWQVDFFGENRMQENFCKLVDGHPNIQVNLNTICKDFIDGMEDIKNLNINVIGEKDE